MKFSSSQAINKTAAPAATDRSKILYLLGFIGFLGLAAGLWQWQLSQLPSAKMGTLIQSLAVPQNQELGRGPAGEMPAPQLTSKNTDLTELQPSLPAAPKMSEAEKLERLSHEDILDDPLNRVSQEFKIPKSMEGRVKFWFDIYTKHGRTTHVIHHTRFPWITYEVLDFKDAIREGKGPEWLRVDRANKFAKKRAHDIRQALKRLALNPKKKKSELEMRLEVALKEIPGPRKKVYAVAAQSLRTQLGQRDFFISGLRRSSRYLPYMEEVFSQSSLPLDLTRMPFVESSFNEQAESKVGASGIWQVMPATGRSYGIVSEAVDERNSPLKATTMASRLLKSYYHALGSWPLAITAYNHGIGNIEKAIRAARSRDLATIIQRYHQGDFKFASSNFYACFLAALYAERYSETTFPSVAREPAFPFERFVITQGQLRLQHLIKQGGLSSSQVLEQNLDLNRKYLTQVVLPKGFILHLPPGSSDFLPERLRRQMRLAPTVPSKISEHRSQAQSDG